MEATSAFINSLHDLLFHDFLARVVGADGKQISIKIELTSYQYHHYLQFNE